jgi:chromosome segregation ATPase
LPASSSEQPSSLNLGSLLPLYYEKLKQMRMIEFNSEFPVTQQIIQMTTSVDNVLNEIRLVFIQILDELVACKFDVLERDQRIVQLKQEAANAMAAAAAASRDRPLQIGSTQIDQYGQFNTTSIALANAQQELESLKQQRVELEQKLDEQRLEQDAIEEKRKKLEETETLLKLKESSILRIENSIKERKATVEEATKALASLINLESNEGYLNENKHQIIESPELDANKSTSDRDGAKFSQLNEDYERLKLKYHSDALDYKKQIK